MKQRVHFAIDVMKGIVEKRHMRAAQKKKWSNSDDICECVMILPMLFQAHFTLEVRANVQPKSSIPIDARVEMGPESFPLGVKAELEQKKINLPQAINKC